MKTRCDNCFLVHGDGAVCPRCGYEKGGLPDELYYLYPGTVLNGRYTIGKALGAGGFGIVYKAWDTKDNVPVAIKEYYPSGMVTRTPGTGNVRLVAKSQAGEVEAGRRRFVAECTGTMKIDTLFAGDPSLPHGVSAFQDNATMYMVMEFLEGETLSRRIDRIGHMSVSEGLGMITSVLWALRDIHSVDILHRDISPDNIILCTDGTVKLFDFGAAKFDKRDNMANAERVLKPGYSPPEQYEPDGGAGAHTDIYATGATLYYALTGIKPEEATNRKDGDLLATPQSLNPDIPKNISDAILKAMAIDYRLRFKSAEKFLQALRGETVALRPEKELAIIKRRRLIAIASTFLVLCVAAAITYFLTSERIPTLNDASVELWYALAGDETQDAQKKAVYERVAEEFASIYPNVSVGLRGIAGDEYEAELESAIERGAPVLFESDGISSDILSGAADLSASANRVSKDAYFLDRYTRLIPARNQLPTGFKVSCVYINTTISSHEDPGVFDLTQLLSTMTWETLGIAVGKEHEPDFAAVFGSVASSPPSDFYAEKVGALFADTSDLHAVQTAFAGRYKLLRIDLHRTPAEFGGMYSMARCDRDELAALARLLEFLIGENAQDALHIQTQSGLIPLNKVALETYQSVFFDFSEFFENIDNYVFTTSS